MVAYNEQCLNLLPSTLFFNMTAVLWWMTHLLMKPHVRNAGNPASGQIFAVSLWMTHTRLKTAVEVDCLPRKGIAGWNPASPLDLTEDSHMNGWLPQDGGLTRSL